jgi:mannose-6-phosphate isomerase-like protein (cupin superfamily)
MLILNRNNSKVINTPHGSEIRPLMDRTTSAIQKCSLAEEILPAGSAVGRHFHRETEEIYYILSGSGEMTVGSETEKVSAGDAVYIPANNIHTLNNTGSEPMKILLVCGAAHDFNDSFPVSDQTA